MNGPVKQRAGGSPGVAVVAKVEGRQKQTGQLKRQESATRLEAEGVKVGHTRKTPPDRTLTRDANPPKAKERFIARPNIPNRSDATARMMAELKALTQAQQQAYPRSQQKAAPATAPLYSADKPAAPARTRAAARIAPPAKTNPTGKAAQQSVDFVPMFEYFKGWEQLPNILESQLPTPPKKDTAGKETTSPDRAQSRAQVLELLKKSHGQSLKLVEDKGKKFISYEPGVRSGGGSMAEQFDQLDQLKLARLLYKISGVELPGYTSPSKLLSHLREYLEKSDEAEKKAVRQQVPARVAETAVRPLRLTRTRTEGKTSRSEGQGRIEAHRQAVQARNVKSADTEVKQKTGKRQEPESERPLEDRNVDRKVARELAELGSRAEELVEHASADARALSSPGSPARPGTAQEKIERCFRALSLATRLVRDVPAAHITDTFFREDVQFMKYDLADKKSFQATYLRGESEAFMKGKSGNEFASYLPALVVEAARDLESALAGVVSAEDIVRLVKLFPDSPNVKLGERYPVLGKKEVKAIQQQLKKLFGKKLQLVQDFSRLLQGLDKALAARSNRPEGDDYFETFQIGYWNLQAALFGRDAPSLRAELFGLGGAEYKLWSSKAKSVCYYLFGSPDDFFMPKP